MPSASAEAPKPPLPLSPPPAAAAACARQLEAGSTLPDLTCYMFCRAAVCHIVVRWRHDGDRQRECGAAGEGAAAAKAVRGCAGAMADWAHCPAPSSCVANASIQGQPTTCIYGVLLRCRRLRARPRPPSRAPLVATARRLRRRTRSCRRWVFALAQAAPAGGWVLNCVGGKQRCRGCSWGAFSGAPRAMGECNTVRQRPADHAHTHC